jgi:hypothetical protein
MWSQTYEARYDRAYSLVETFDGGFALAGDSLLIKTDASGNMEWNRTYGGTLRALVATSDGEYALAGYTSGDFLLIKTNATGYIEWSETYGIPGTYSYRAYSLIETSDGGYALWGSYGFTEPVNFKQKYYDCYLVKTDSSGNMEWNQTYDWTTSRNIDTCSLVEASDGGYVLSAQGSLIKTDASGNIQWNTNLGSNFYSKIYSLVATSDGFYTIAGYEIEEGYADFWLAKVDLTGRIQWSKTYWGGSDDDIAYSLVEAPDGGYLMTGKSSLSGKNGAWLVKTDSAGNKEWDRKIVDSDYYPPFSSVATSDGEYAIAGSILDFGFWLAKTAPSSTPTPTPSLSPSPTPTATPTATSSPEPTTPESTSSPTPFPTNYTGIRLTETDIIIGAAIVAAVIGGGLGLLIYLTKRK